MSALYLLSRKDAPRGRFCGLIFKKGIDGSFDADASVIEGYAATARGIYVDGLAGGSFGIDVLFFGARARYVVRLPAYRRCIRSRWAEWGMNCFLSRRRL